MAKNAQNYKDQYQELSDRYDALNKLFTSNSKEMKEEIEDYISQKEELQKQQQEEEEKQLDNIDTKEKEIEDTQKTIDDAISELEDKYNKQKQDAEKTLDKLQEIVDMFPYVSKDSYYYKAYQNKLDYDKQISELKTEINAEDSQERIDFLNDKLEDLYNKRNATLEETTKYERYFNKLKLKGYSPDDEETVMTEYNEQNEKFTEASNILTDGVEDYYYSSTLEGKNNKEKIEQLKSELETLNKVLASQKKVLQKIFDNIEILRSRLSVFEELSTKLEEENKKLEQIGSELSDLSTSISINGSKEVFIDYTKKED